MARPPLSYGVDTMSVGYGSLPHFAEQAISRRRCETALIAHHRPMSQSAVATMETLSADSASCASDPSTASKPVE